MRSMGFATAAVGGLLVLVGFAGAAHASATIDLIWADTGTNEIRDVNSSSAVALQVILTAGSRGLQGAGVSVDYSEAVGVLGVIGYTNTPGGPLPLELGSITDTGTRIQNINSTAFPPFIGSGLAAGQSWQLGTVTFHKNAFFNGVREIRSDANGPTDGILDLEGAIIAIETVEFNSAFLYDDSVPCSCDFVIEINALRGGSPTVAVNATKDITAKARLAKGSTLPDTTVAATLQIDAIDGAELIDSQSSGPIQLEVGKGGNGDKLSMNINQCNTGSIYFKATFSVPVPSCSNNPCSATRTISKSCQ